MNKLKKFWRFLAGHLLKRLKSYSPKKRRLIIVMSSFSVLIIGGLLYYGVALARISEAEINLAALRENINNEKICHEECLLVRKKQEEIIIIALKNVEENLLKRMKTYFLSSEESLEFKEEIINLWRLNNDFTAVPPYIYEYLDDENGDPKLQVLIIGSLLSPDNDPRWLDYYFSLLTSKRDVSLKKEALNALSNREDKEGEFNLRQLVFLKNLLLNSETPLEIKSDLVLLIGEYYPLFPEDTELILEDVYANKEIDNITRAFATDILNRYLKGKKLTAPAISGEEWEKYYNY